MNIIIATNRITRKRRWYICFLVATLTMSSYAQGSDDNYVLTITMTDSNQSIEEIEYFDGLGRSFESVLSGHTPQQNDMVTYRELDKRGRVKESWLPTSMPPSSSSYDKVDVVSSARTLYGDTWPYGETYYDGTPLSVVVSERMPGSEWYLNNKIITTSYNTNNSCRKYICSGNNKVKRNGNYTAGELETSIVTDEDGYCIASYRDMFGHEVLRRAYQDNNSQQYADTYFVYDAKGNLRFVLPPGASDILTSNTEWNITSNSTLQKYAYYYEYDNRNHCVKKKLPGCDPLVMKYDHAGRLVYSQDGNQKENNQWTFFLYDKYGREVVTGIHTASSVTLGSYTTVLATYTGSGAYGGYSANIACDTDKLLSITYYDDYSFIPSSQSSSLAYQVQSGYDEQYVNGSIATKGLMTGKQTFILPAPSGITSTLTVYYYDQQGRVIQTHTTNHIGGHEDYYHALSLTGKVLKTKHVHSNSDSDAITEVTTYNYDHGERLVEVKHKLDNNPQRILATYTYDELGRVSSKNVGGIENVSYDYNVRSWLTNLSSTNFKETLAYNKSVSLLQPGDGASYSGNISAMRWKASGDTQYRGYHFTYDDQNRLSEAIYGEGSGSITNNEKYSVYFSYDNMGNMTELMRKGLSSGAYTFIDDLELAYNGNQLISVEDNAIDPSYNGAFNFVGNSSSGAYEYDKNGNLTKDLNKNILSIEYNCLNLPQTISFPYMDNFCYTYDAEGRKLHTEQSVTTLTPLPISTMISTDYCDNFVYSLHNQIKILFDGGYITLDEDIPTYHFYLQDHLGSNRVVINQNGTVEQVNHYYPFGGLMGDICVNQETQLYKYNGKELDRTHGLDWYDYGARHYDAVLGRWHAMDPLCEKYYDISPYAYCSNSPVLHNDSNGQIKRKYYNMDDDLDYNNNGIPDLNILLQDYRLFDDGGDRVFNFWAHGDATGFDYQGKEVHSRGPGSVDFFYNMIQNDTELKNSFERNKDDGLIIVLHMCSTAKFAEKLSQDRRFKNVTFIAPNGNLQVRETKDKNGKTYSAEVLSPSKPDSLYGVWKSYRNGVNIANYNYNSRPGSRGFDYEKNRPNHMIDGNKY